jgi:hypothetical protein
MLLIWRGLGILVVVIALGCSLAANLVTDRLTGSGAYWRGHGWPFACALMGAGIICYLLGHALARAAARNQTDPSFSARVGVPARNEFFFIKMQWWGPILVGIAIVILLAGWSPG